MKTQDIVMLALIAGGGFLAYQMMSKGQQPQQSTGLSERDMLLVQAMKEQQAAAAANQAQIMAIIAQNRAVKGEKWNPLQDGQFITDMAKLGVQLTTSIIAALK